MREVAKVADPPMASSQGVIVLEEKEKRTKLKIIGLWAYVCMESESSVEIITAGK